MTNAPRLSDRVSRLRQLQAANGLSAPSPAAPLPGDWPPGCQAYQASFAQARLWFLHQLEPELTAYHRPAVWRLRGDLDGEALQRALEGLIERHSTLRTSFRLQGSEVIQVVHPAPPIDLAAEASSDRDPEVVIQGWLEEESRTPFDLTAGLLLRVRLLTVDDQEHGLLINHHHIASDGWSRSVLARDLVELYNAQVAGRSAQLEPLSIHYPDYAAWQRQRLSGERLQELNDYWIGQLRDLEPLELPSDRPRPPTPSYRGERVSFQIEPALMEPFEELCRGEGATLQMGLLAVVALLLYRYSHQEDFVIGVPIWGRNHPDLEKLIGFFINTLPIRIRFSPEQSFRELLVQVRDRSIGAYDHQDLPFEQMVEALKLERDRSRNPVVQVMMQLMELPESSVRNFDGLEVEPLPTGTQSTTLDLGFTLTRNLQHGLTGVITYASDLFEAESIERLSRLLMALLDSLVGGMATQADLPLGRLNILPREEREQLLAWSHPSAPARERLLVHQFAAMGDLYAPAAPAVRYQDSVLSHGDLASHVDGLARRLLEQGVRPGQRVGILLERRLELPVSMLAVLTAGGCYVPLDPGYPDERIAMLLDNAAVELVITSTAMAERIRPRRTLLFSLSDSKGYPSRFIDSQDIKPDIISFPSIGDSDPAYLIHTSGTTARPKAVEVSHRSAMQMLHYRLECLTPPWACGLVPFYGSIAFDASVAQIFTVLAAGGCLLMLDTITDLASSPHAGRVTAVSGTSSSIREMIFERLMPRNVQVIGMGAEKIPADLIQRLQEFPHLRHLFIVYGLTEAAGFSTALTVEREQLADFAACRNNIGTPIPGASVYVLDKERNLLPPGVSGEIHIGGDGVAKGYLQAPEEEQERFLPDPFGHSPGGRLLRTGDVGRWTNSGKLLFLGRMDQQLKLRGHRIEPADIEANLLQHEAVGQAVVILNEQDPANPRLIAYWTPDFSNRSQNTADFECLRSFLAERLPSYMVPSAIVKLEALPLTANGKLDYRALPVPCFSADQEKHVEPNTELEKLLVAIWAEVLGHEEFGTTENFFDIGGHSLAAARLANRINQITEFQCRVSDIFSFSSIQSLARHMGGLPGHDILII
jgi:amino acid adenylation domain-containing protein